VYKIGLLLKTFMTSQTPTAMKAKEGSFWPIRSETFIKKRLFYEM